MKPKMTLTNPTDDELSLAVALHVAGYKESHLADIKVIGMPDGPKQVYANTDQTHWACKFYYATSADAVLPLLEAYHEITCMKYAGQWQVIIQDAGGDGHADTFPRAACVALLQANGVEVVQ